MQIEATYSPTDLNRQQLKKSMHSKANYCEPLIKNINEMTGYGLIDITNFYPSVHYGTKGALPIFEIKSKEEMQMDDEDDEDEDDDDEDEEDEGEEGDEGDEGDEGEEEDEDEGGGFGFSWFGGGDKGDEEEDEEDGEGGEDGEGEAEAEEEEEEEEGAEEDGAAKKKKATRRARKRDAKGTSTLKTTEEVKEKLTSKATKGDKEKPASKADKNTKEEPASKANEEAKEKPASKPTKKASPDYKLSNCQVNKRALLVGINYYGYENELYDSIKNALNMQSLLINTYGFNERDITLLRDDSKNPDFMPTHNNIRRCMAKLCQNSLKDESLFFYFSGYGGNQEDLDGDELDGKDEFICPCDTEKKGPIIDDDMYDLMVKPLCAGARLTAVFDCSNSGTALDLSYIYSSDGQIKENSSMKEEEKNVFRMLAHRRTAIKLFSSFMGIEKSSTKTNVKTALNLRSTKSPADVVMFSGYSRHNASVDDDVSEKAIGALSNGFINALKQNPKQTYKELLQSVQHNMPHQYKQSPLVSSNHPIDFNQVFFC